MMMAVLGRRIDLDLNCSASECSDSVKELLRNAMLQHDATFKHQVRELNRLYWTQKNLMKEHCYKKTGIFPFQPTMGRSLVDPCVVELIGCDVVLPNDSIVRNDRFMSREVTKNEYVASDDTKDCGIDSRCIRHTVNLEEPAELEDNRDADVVSLNFVETPQYDRICIGCIPPLSKSEKTNVGGLDNFGLVNCGMKKSPDLLKESTDMPPAIGYLMQKQQSSSCRLLDIDLNAALDDEFRHASHDPRLMFPSPSTSSSVTQQIVNEPHIASCSMKGIPRESSNIASKESSINSALRSSKEEDTGDLYCPDKVKSEEDSWTLDLVEAENGVFSKGSNKLVTKSVEIVCNSRDGEAGKRDGEASKLSIVLCELEKKNMGVSVDYEDSVVDGNDKRKLMSRQNSSVTCSSNIVETNCLHASLGSSYSSPCQGIQKIREGSQDDTLSSHTTEHDEDQKDVNDDEYPKNKRSNSLIEMEQKDAENSGTTQEDLAGPEICHVDKRKVDELMIKAAEMLVSISLQSSACLPAFLTSEDAGVLDQEMKYESEYDSDSFEFLTLNLPESKYEEVFISSPIVEKEMYKESCGIKLRRGRGLRDFQKEILPGLVSLSRREICEDLHNIGYEFYEKLSRGRRRRNPSRRRC